MYSLRRVAWSYSYNMKVLVHPLRGSIPIGVTGFKMWKESPEESRAWSASAPFYPECVDCGGNVDPNSPNKFRETVEVTARDPWTELQDTIRAGLFWDARSAASFFRQTNATVQTLAIPGRAFAGGLNGAWEGADPDLAFTLTRQDMSLEYSRGVVSPNVTLFSSNLGGSGGDVTFSIDPTSGEAIISNSIRGPSGAGVEVSSDGRSGFVYGAGMGTVSGEASITINITQTLIQAFQGFRNNLIEAVGDAYQAMREAVGLAPSPNPVTGW